eukprot:3476089-Amphidinium_carterae.1
MHHLQAAGKPLARAPPSVRRQSSLTESALRLRSCIVCGRHLAQVKSATDECQTYLLHTAAFTQFQTDELVQLLLAAAQHDLSALPGNVQARYVVP